MKDFIKNFLLFVNIIAAILVSILGIVGVVYELLGPENFEDFLLQLNIPWDFDCAWNVSMVCVAVCVITYFLRSKFFEK